MLLWKGKQCFSLEEKDPSAWLCSAWLKEMEWLLLRVIGAPTAYRDRCVFFFFSFSTICVLKSIFINVSFNLVLYMKVCSFQNLFKMTNHIAFIADKSLSSSYARHTQSLVAPVTVCAVLVADHMESVSAFSKSLPRHVMSCKTFFRFKSSDVISSPVLIF